MIYVLLVFVVVVTPTLMFGQWVLLERKHNRRHEELRGKYNRFKARAEKMLTNSKLQVSSLQHQLSGARLEVKRAERPFEQTAIQSRRPQAPDSLLMVFGADDASRPMEYQSDFVELAEVH